MKILVVEDEPTLNKIIAKRLKIEAYSVDCAFNGKEALDYLDAAEYDLLIVDIMMPEMDGLTLVKKLRDGGSRVPVLFLTALDSTQDKVTGLDSGGDDYLVKPFDVVELLARVEVVLRRFHKTGAQLSAGDVVVDMDARMVTKAGMPVVLTNKEYGLLVLFIQNKNIALFKENLYEKVWGEEYDGDSRTLELHVQRLRKKMGWERQLVAVYKVGYRLEIA